MRGRSERNGEGIGELRERIGIVRRSLRRSEVVRGILASLLFSLIAVIVSLLIESTFRPGPAVRTILFWCVAVGSALMSAVLVGRPLLRAAGILRAEDDEELAALIGAALPSVGDRLLNGLQLAGEREKGFYSVALVDAALADLRTALRAEDFGTVVSFAASRRLSRFLTGGALLFALLFLLFPDPFAGSIDRLWRHGESFAVPPPFSFIVEPGDREVIKGESVPVTVRIQGISQPEITLITRREGEEVEEKYPLPAEADGSFHHTFSSLRASTTYSVERRGVTSPLYRLTVIDRPVVRLLKVSLRSPAYSGLPFRELDDQIGDITALKGTRAVVSITTSTPCSSASLLFDGGERILFHLRGERGNAEFTLRSPGRYRVVLRDSLGIESVDPIDYSVTILPDAPPTAAIPIPGTNLDVTEKTKLPMLFRIADDYGFTSLRLAARIVQSRYSPPDEHPRMNSIPIPPEARTEAVIRYTWDLAPFNLVPDDIVEYYLEVTDNDAVSGPKRGVSETFRLRYPSMEEVLADVDREQEQALTAMQEALARAEESKRKMEELKQELKKEGEKGEWQERKAMEELIARQEEMRQAVDRVAQALEKTTEQLSRNQLLSPETMEKYQELQRLMEELNSPELAEALKQLQQSMQQMSLEQMRQALQQYSYSEENFRAGLERTLNLLKRIQIEQKLDALARQAEGMEKSQESVQEQTAEAALKAEAAARQRDLAQRAETLREEMSQLEKSMEQFPGEMPTEELAHAGAELDSAALRQNMEKIAQQIERGESAEAQQGQRQSRQTLSRAAQQMRQASKSMQQNQQKQLVAAMRQVAEDLLELSRREEEMKKETRGLEQQSGQFRNGAQDQMEAMRDLGGVAERLGGMANKSFSVTPEMGRSIGEALRQMGEAMRALEQRNGTVAAEAQGSAMAALNESAVQAQNAAQSLMQSGGQGMGMSGLLQRLRQMSARQQGINGETQGLTPEQAAAMARLAAEQGAVRKSLEELAREATSGGQMSRLLGDLKRVAEEMREVQTDLARGAVTPETLEKQERILSRLLDSQRSTRERDYEERRRAESGTNVVRPGPGPVDVTTREGRARLRKDLLRALEEGYARDYEEVIRKYFEALER